mgnify:CR=1 FL=1
MLVKVWNGGGHWGAAARLRKPDGMPRAVDVGDALLVGRRADVVDRGEVEEVRDLALEPAHVRGADAEPRTREVARNGDHLPVARTPVLAQRGELLLGALAHQHVDGLAARDEVGDQVTADESGRAGDEDPRAHGTWSGKPASRRFCQHTSWNLLDRPEVPIPSA